MIYIVIGDDAWNRRLQGELDFADHVAVEVQRKSVSCRVIGAKKFMDMVDEYAYPTDKGDTIYLRTLTLNVLKASNVLRARGFKLVNSHETLCTLRDYRQFNSLMIENKIPTVFMHDQLFEKTNLDRSRGFGQGFVDFLREYIKEYNITSFYLRTKHFNLLHKLTNESDFTKIDTSFIWSLIESPPAKHYTRSRIIGKKFVKGSILASSTTDYATKMKIESAEVEALAQRAADAINLEIGYVDIIVDANDKCRVLSAFELGVDTGPDLGIDYSKQISKYLAK